MDGPYNLTVNTAGVTQFQGVVGGLSPLTSLTTDAAGSTNLNANVTTTTTMTLQDAVNLTHDVTLQSQGAGPNGTIDFDQTVDGPYNLIVNTAGITLFEGLVGGSSPLTSLTTDADGSTSLNADVTTATTMTFHDTVNLTHDVTLQSQGTGPNGTIDFDETVDGPFNLTVNTAGVTQFQGVVGGSSPLTSLTTDAAGSTSLNANVTTVTTTTFHDSVNLTHDVTLQSQGAGPSGTIDFDQTVDGPFNLTVNTAGITQFQGVIGGCPHSRR